MKKFIGLLTALSIAGCSTTNSLNLTTNDKESPILAGNSNKVQYGCKKEDLEKLVHTVASILNAAPADKQNSINSFIAICSGDIVVPIDVINNAFNDLISNGKFDKIIAIFKNEEKRISNGNLQEASKIKNYINSLSPLNDVVNNPPIKDLPQNSQIPIPISTPAQPRNPPSNPNLTEVNKIPPLTVSISGSLNNDKKEATTQDAIDNALLLKDSRKFLLHTYRRDTQLDPDNVNKWDKLGSFLEYIDLNEAINVYQTILRLGQEHRNQEEIGIAYNKLGVLYLKNNDLNKAYDFYNKALIINESLAPNKIRGITIPINIKSSGIFSGTRSGFYKLYKDIFYKHNCYYINNLKDDYSTGISYKYSGVIYLIYGDWKNARCCWEKSLILFNKVNYPHRNEEIKQNAKIVQGWLNALPPEK